MRYKLLGYSGLRVSEMCLGTMTFGDDWGWGATKEESHKIFDLFVQAGGNFIDTANNYTNGTSETFLGEFIKGDRDHFVIATKYTLSERGTDPNFGGNHRKNMRRSVEGSLKRLDTDHIDLLWLHMWDGMTPVEEVMRALDDLVRAGKILYIGISDTPAWVVSQANMLADLRGWSRFVAYQGEYSLASRAPERDILPMTLASEMAFLAWGALEGGELTGKYNSLSSEPKRSKETSERIKAIASVLMNLAQEIGRTASQVAINWVRQRPFQMIPIIGARTQKQLEDNLGCLEFELTRDQITRLSEASPIDLGFPHSFLGSDHVRGLIFGKTFDQIVTNRVLGRQADPASQSRH
jgi:aryl-alcohol dehydrogenase-like predicted oxidoreductase